MGARERLREVKTGQKNVGGAERVLRAVVGPGLVAVGIASLLGVVTLAEGTMGVGLGVVAVLAGLRMSQTAITQRCYMNALVGRDSCRFASTEPDENAGTET